VPVSSYDEDSQDDCESDLNLQVVYVQLFMACVKKPESLCAQLFDINAAFGFFES
jgi:hypothetical protein